MSLAKRRIDRRVQSTRFRANPFHDRRTTLVPHPSDYRLTPADIAAIASVAGILAACAGIEVYAWLAHVPGIEVIFS